MDQPTSLKGKRALVCGSSQGIGRACAIEFAKRGARVTLLARREEQLNRVCAELKPVAHGHEVVVADLSEPDDLKERLRHIITPSAPYHILVNNTGGPPGGEIYRAEPEEFLKAATMHLASSQVLAQALVPGMKKTGYGRVLNVLSTSVREPLPGLGVSNSTRAAVAAWAKTLARELADQKITVNNVLPGLTDTSRMDYLIEKAAAAQGLSEREVRSNMSASVPMQRFAKAEEIAYALAFLASPAASYISGVSLPVDGGRLHSI